MSIVLSKRASNLFANHNGSAIVDNDCPIVDNDCPIVAFLRHQRRRQFDADGDIIEGIKQKSCTQQEIKINIAIIAYLWVTIERTSHLSVAQMALCWKALNMFQSHLTHITLGTINNTHQM